MNFAASPAEPESLIEGRAKAKANRQMRASAAATATGAQLKSPAIGDLSLLNETPSAVRNKSLPPR